MMLAPKNKSLVVISLIVLVAGIIFLLTYPKKVEISQTPQPLSDPENTTYTVEGTPVKFKNSLAETKPDPNSATVNKYQIFAATTQGDINGDGAPDIAVIFTVDMGGSGTFFYAAGALKTSTGYQGTNAVLIGDRIAPQTQEIKDGIMIINYADRKPGEDFSVQPSQGKSLYLEYFKGTLVARPEAVQLTSPYPYAEITSPLKISGQARGTWFFEASFPVTLMDWDGKIIAQGIAQAKGDWVTENFVPFEATLTFTKPTTKNNGSLILKKDNPSGLPQNDQAYEIPIVFK